MPEGVVKKCRYYIFEYLRCTKKEIEWQKFHPKEVCKVSGCRAKISPNRHPKTYKIKDKWRFQTSCLYNHVMKFNNTEEQEDLTN